MSKNNSREAFGFTGSIVTTIDYDYIETLEISLRSIKRENDQLRECIKDCPIFSESKFGNYAEFEKWCLEYNYILKDL